MSSLETASTLQKIARTPFLTLLALAALPNCVGPSKLQSKRTKWDNGRTHNEPTMRQSLKSSYLKPLILFPLKTIDNSLGTKGCVILTVKPTDVLSGERLGISSKLQ